MKISRRFVGWVIAAVLFAGGCGSEGAGTNANDDDDASTSTTSGGAGGGGAGVGGGVGGDTAGVGGMDSTSSTGGGEGGQGGEDTGPNPDAFFVVFQDGTDGNTLGTDMHAQPPKTYTLPVAHAAAMSPEGDLLFAIGANDEMLLVDFTVAPPVVDVATGWSRFQQAEMSPVAPRAFVRGRRDGENDTADYVVDRSGNVLHTMPQYSWAAYGRWSPDGDDKAMVETGGGRITSIDGVVHPFTDSSPGGSDREHVVWAPTSDRVAYVKDGPSASEFRVFVIEVGEATAVELVSAANVYLDEFPPSWSADGQRLAFYSGNSVSIADFSGGTPVVTEVPDAYAPRGFGFSPTSIFFSGGAFQKRWYTDALPLGMPSVTIDSTQSYLGHGWSSGARWFCQHGVSNDSLYDASAFPSDVTYVRRVEGCSFSRDESYLFAAGSGTLWDMRATPHVEMDVHDPTTGDWAGLGELGSDIHIVWRNDDRSYQRRIFDGQSWSAVESLVSAPMYSQQVHWPSSFFERDLFTP